MRNLLLKQYELHPKMQLQDMIKLIYQNEFAGGHFIADEVNSLKHLREECSSLEGHSSCSDISACTNISTNVSYDEIGNGLSRLNLISLINKDIQLETVNKFFVNTANTICGNIKSFEEKLGILRECCISGELPYPPDELDAYLYMYKSQGYPPVSHSMIYRTAYTPAYRIIKKEYCSYIKVFSKIDALLKLGGTVNVCIDGNSGAGKSTLAKLISSVYDCNVFHMDDFFLRPEQRSKARLKEPGGNVDYERFRLEVINGLQSRCAFMYGIYDCKKMTIEQHVPVTPKRLNIIEGSYSMHPTLSDNYGLKIFLHINEKEQSERILKRNGVLMHKRFLEEWIPLENKYFNELEIEEQCDLVFTDIN